MSLDNPVYGYLQRMQTLDIISDYNPGNIPLSREVIAAYLKTIKENQKENHFDR